MTVKLLTEQHLGFLSLKGGCTGSSEFTHVKMPHCWKSHVRAQFVYLSVTSIFILQPVASCAMPVMKGMRVKTDSEMTKRAR